MNCVVAGDGSFYFMKDRRLYGCGKNLFGQQGNGKGGWQGKDVETITEIAFPRNEIPWILKSESSHFTLTVLTLSGKLMCCGSNESGEYGNGQIGKFRNVLGEMKCYRSRKVSDFFATGKALWVKLGDNSWWRSGNNNFCKLGDFRIKTNFLFPRKLDKSFLMSDEDIDLISSSNCHTMLVTKSGRIYACGKNRDTQLGISYGYYGNKNRSWFTRLSFFENQSIFIKQVCCGSKFTMFCTLGGAAFCCGSEAITRFKYSDPDRSPIRIKQFGNSIRKIACGLNHMLFLTEAGQVFFCGGPRYKRSPKGICHDSMTLVKSHVQDIAASSSSNIFVEDTGDLFLYGTNCLNFTPKGGISTRLTVLVRPKKVDHFSLPLIGNIRWLEFNLKVWKNVRFRDIKIELSD